MNTFSSTLNYRFSAIAVLGMALTIGVWAAPSADTQPATSTNKSEARAVREIAMVYPYEMLIQGKPGWADASFVIGYAGQPLFTTPDGSSDPAFARAAVAMIEANRFTPVKKARRMTMAKSVQRFTFGGDASLSPGTRRVIAELRKERPAICSVTELDERPKVLRQDAPVYPRAMKDDGLTGQAEIEFVVTVDGEVVCPRIVSASQEDFGWAAATAVAQWRFQAPIKNGQKVDARMIVPVLFDARRLAASD